MDFTEKLFRRIGNFSLIDRFNIIIIMGNQFSLAAPLTCISGYMNTLQCQEGLLHKEPLNEGDDFFILKLLILIDY